MSLTVSMAASWDDAYPDPDVLEQVQQQDLLPVWAVF